MSSMFQMKEDVENEFSDRMEQLRDMYKTGLANKSIFQFAFCIIDWLEGQINDPS